MQFPRQGKPPLGVIFCTTMCRPDSALALAVLNHYQGKREARIGAVSVNGAGLAAAVFCDVVNRFYDLGPRPADSNRRLPVGLAADAPLPPDITMVKVPVDRLTDKGEPLYARSVRRVSDTAEPAALIRNAVTGQSKENSVLILSAPAMSLARSLALPGTRELVAERVKSLVIVDAVPQPDVQALRMVLTSWPTNVILCPREIGSSLSFPGSSIEKDFAWAAAHPVVDAYKTYQQMPYDAPSWDLVAMLFAINPDDFKLSNAGSIQVKDDGAIQFTEGSGTNKVLMVDESKRATVVEKFMTAASAKPVPPRIFGRPPSAAAQQQK